MRNFKIRYVPNVMVSDDCIFCSIGNQKAAGYLCKKKKVKIIKLKNKKKICKNT